MANIIVTGSSRGIGFELVKLLAEEGHQILALSRNEEPVAGLKYKNVTSIPFDLNRTDHLESLCERLREENMEIDVLVNNAGRLINKPFLETDPEEFRKVYDVNVFGLAELTRRVLPRMKKDGHVVVISSMGGIQGSVKFPGLSAYSSSKAAVIALTELWAEEFKDTGPSFNALALGAVQTEMLREAFPGYKAPLSASEMAAFIKEFSLTGQRYFNGKVLQLSSTTP